MDTIEALEQVFAHTGRVIGGVTPAQLDRPTPCAEWNVRQLLTHTVGVVANIGHGVKGEETRDIMSFPLAAAPGPQFNEIAADTLAAWKARGLDGETNIGAGPMPASAAIGINLLDTLTHAWDIARATGQPEELPEPATTMVLGICKGFITDELRQFAGFAAAIEPPAGASTTQQLVAFLGREA